MVSVSAWGLAGGGCGWEGGGGPGPGWGQPHHLHFQAINLMFVRFANRWGPRGRTVRADGEPVNKNTGPLLRTTNLFERAGRKAGKKY